MARVATKAAEVAHSGIREIVHLVAERRGADIVRLEIGQPDHPTPPHIVEAATTGAGTTGYTPSAGIRDLREAIADRLVRVHGISVPSEQVVVTQGAVQACALTLAALVETGDEVLVPDPSWPNFEMLVTLYGGRPVRYPLRAQDGFLPDPDEVGSLVTDRTVALVVNSPSNPTGAVFPPDAIEALTQLAREHDLVLIADEVYDELIFEGEPARAVLRAPDHVVGIYSFSKTYAMTGWRVGYAVAPSWLSSTLAKLQEPLISCISEMSQVGALAALTGPQGPVSEMRDTYAVRRDLALGLLREGALDVVPPSGAFYVMIPLARGTDSRLAAIELVDRGVSLAPGTAFGEVAADHLRLSLASSEADLREGISRLLAWHHETEGGSHLFVESVPGGR